MTIPNEVKCVFCNNMCRRGETVIAPSFIDLSYFCPYCGAVQIYRQNRGERIREISIQVTKTDPLSTKES